VSEAEEIAEGGLEGQRPLPSVDMPLLKEERRARLARRVIAASGAVILIGGGAAAAVWAGWEGVWDQGDSEGGPEGSHATSAAPPAGEEAPADAAADGSREGEEVEAQPAPVPVDDETPTTLGAETRVSTAFGQARGFRDALTRAGASHDECVELEEALGDVMDFRRCRPQDRMVFERDTDGHLVLFEYRGGSATAYYQARRNERGGLRGERVEIPVERTRVARAGVLRTSLGNALERAGFGRSLVGVFIEVFENHANFTTDARAGDTFKVIVDEERVSGRFLRWSSAHALEYVGQRTGTLRAFYYEPARGRGDYYDETGRAVHGGWLRTPVRYDRISSRFDPRRRHPILHRIVPHNGVDYAAGSGTTVRAAADGVITWAGERGANGNLVSIRHDGGYESHYAHLLRIERGIRRDTRVEQRQVIGYVGTTGRSTGPHLHFGLKRNGRFVDPLEVINGPGRMMPAAALGRYRGRVRRLTAELGRIEIEQAAEAPAPEPEPEPEVPEEAPMD